MSTPVAWLREQLATDERIAQTATPGPWHWTPQRDLASGEPGWPTSLVLTAMPEAQEEVAEVDILTEDQEHITRWDPAKVAADIESKIAILDQIDSTLSRTHTNPYDDPGDGESGLALSVLRALAQPYADRSGFPQEWRTA